MPDLYRRTAVAAFALLVVLPIIYRGGWILGVLAAAVAVVGTREFCVMARTGGTNPFMGAAMILAAALVLAAALEPWFNGFAPGALAILTIAAFALPVAALQARPAAEGPLAAVCVTIVSALYVGGGICFGLLLRYLPEAGTAVRSSSSWEGPLLLLFPLVVTWVADSAAYFAGNWLGGRRLFPAVSPGKTVAGSVGGLIAALGAGMFFAHVASEPFLLLGVTPAMVTGIALLAGVGSQVGDLALSLMKRESGIKDFGSLLPGHGGILDRIDGVLVALPLTYAALRVASVVS